MAEETEIAADPMLQLLSDALRAGPASPEWASALLHLHAGGVDDERALLLKTRDSLESGKAFREVRAGPGFTRKLMGRLVNDTPEGAKKKSPLGISLLSYLGACAIVTAASVVTFVLLNGATGGGENLSGLFFRTVVATTRLDGPLSGAWRVIGPLGVDPARGLVPTEGHPTPDYRGGGIVSTTAVSAAEPFAVEVTLQFNHVSDDEVPQVFVTDRPVFDGDTATSGRELVWLVRGGVSQVALVDGSLVVSTQKIPDNKTLSVRIVVGVSEAQVSSDGRTIWSGASKLNGQARYVGVRMLRRGDNKGANVVVKAVKILEK